ncbi:alpha/beta hydrolase [Ureibacillus composti]|nr:alpha/beta hydrolase [Ureibacillus composti]
MWKWEAEGKPKAVVVIIHSAFEHHQWYAWLIEQFRSEGYHVVMGDLPGHGEDAKYNRVHDETVVEYMLYIKHLMQIALTYGMPVFILGQGLGGTLAIQFLKKNKVECAGLILSSPWLHLKKKSNLLTNALTSLGTITPKKKISLELDKKLLTRHLEGYHEMTGELPYNSNMTVRSFRSLQQLMKNLTTQQESSVSLPLLMMTAQQDKITDVTISKKWLLQQNASEIHYKDWAYSYHNLFHDQERELVFIYVKDFMNNVMRSLGYIIK